MTRRKYIRFDPVASGRSVAWWVVWLTVVAVVMAGSWQDYQDQRAADKLLSDHHNAAGGYRPACGELPGLVGDDC